MSKPDQTSQQTDKTDGYKVAAALHDPEVRKHMSAISREMLGGVDVAAYTLLAPDLANAIEHKPIVHLAVDGSQDLRRVAKRQRGLASDIRRAQKYIFDSGQDHPDMAGAVLETSLAMMEFDLFHLPHPLVWIEDPFESMPFTRYYYLCEEHGSRIDIRLFQSASGTRMGFTVVMLEPVMTIDLTSRSNSYLINGKPDASITAPMYCGEAVYGVKKFLTALAAKHTIVDKVERKSRFSKGSGGLPSYAHTIVTVPLDNEVIAKDGDSTEGGGRRRKHLVSGYVWGKNSRPEQEQRWIAPFWRGSADLGVIERDYAVLKGQLKHEEQHQDAQGPKPA